MADDLDQYATERWGTHLLARIIQNPDGLGDWRTDGKAIFSPATDNAFLRIPALLRGEFELKLVVFREAGFGELRIAIPNHGVLVLDGGENHTTCGLELIDGRSFSDNETTIVNNEPVIAPGRRMEITCICRDSGIRVLSNGEELIKWRGNATRMQLPQQLTGIGIGSSGCVTRLDSLVVDNIIY